MSNKLPSFLSQPKKQAVQEYEVDARDVGVVEPTVARAKVVAGVPAYNEVDSIGEVVSSADRYVDEVVVVDDGSTDGTREAAREAGATVVFHETNKGYGGALRTLFREANERDASSLVTIDADGQHKAADIPRLLERLHATDAEVAIGSRFLEDSHSDPPLYRRFGIQVINVLTNMSLATTEGGSWLSDTQSGFRAYSECAIESIATDDQISENMAASLDIIYHACREGYTIEEVGVTIDYPPDETSSQNSLSHGLGLVAHIAQYVLLRPFYR